MPSAARPHVLIIGSGFGGLFAAKRLRRTDVTVTILAPTTHHLFQPLLYQVATGILSEGDIAPATRAILHRQRNTTVLLGEATRVDLAARTVTATTILGEQALTYDHLVVAAGARTAYFGNDSFAEHAPGLKSIDDALELRGRIFGAFELAELSDDPDQIARLLTFVVVGAGPTGVEMAGQIRELARRSLPGDFRRIDPSTARVILLDAADAVLGTFAPTLSARARAHLTGMGIEVQLGAMVVGVDQSGLDVKDRDGTRRRIDAVCKVWAAGVGASPLGAQLAAQTGAEVDRAGRVKVLDDLTLPGHPEVHLIGDMITRPGVPGVAQGAIQAARHAADDIRDQLRGEGPKGAFVYRNKGDMATISRFYAVAEIGRIRTTGFLAWLLWLGVHLLYVVGFKSRTTTLLHWAVSFLGRARSERTTTEQQVFARQALLRQGALEPRSVPPRAAPREDPVHSAPAVPATTATPPAAQST